MKDYSNHFRELVEGQLGEDPRILVPRGAQDMMILATWRLAVGAYRANKRSRMIRIVIAQDALEGYARGGDDARRSSDERFVQWLQRQLAAFDPNHDSPLGVEPPAVTWPVSTTVLNS